MSTVKIMRENDSMNSNKKGVSPVNVTRITEKEIEERESSKPYKE